MLAATESRFLVVFFFFLHLSLASHSTVGPPKDDCTESEAETDPNCFETQPTFDGPASTRKPNNSVGLGTDYDIVPSKQGKTKEKCQKKSVKSKCKNSQRKGKRRPNNAGNISRKRRAGPRKKSRKRRKTGEKQKKQSGRKRQGFQNR